MAFSLGTMTAYIEENKADLISKAITGSRIMDFVDVRENVKSGMRIPILESTAPAQAGAACGFTSSGTTTISQTTISTTSLKVEEAWCLKDLEAYFTQKWLKPGQKPDDTAIIADILNRKMANIAQKFGMMIVQGDTDYTNDTWLKKLNGIISTVDAASDEILATAQASISTLTVRGIFEEIVFQKIPSAILNKGAIVMCGQDTFRILLQKLWVDNLYHFNPGTEMNSMELIYPGTNVKVVAMADFNNDNPVETGSLPTVVKNRIIATYKENIVVGLDRAADMTDFKVWYSDDNEQLRMRFRINAGVAVHFTDQVVSYVNS